jgi:hypothetical protein
VPDFRCVDPMPVRALAARQQKEDRRRRRADDRERSRGNGRPPDAA